MSEEHKILNENGKTLIYDRTKSIDNNFDEQSQPQPQPSQDTTTTSDSQTQSQSQPSDSESPVKVQPFKKTKKEIYRSYSTLEEFGYHYNKNGQLRSIGSDEKFKFVDQEHYEIFGDLIAQHIQELMEKNHGLQNISIPLSPAQETEIDESYASDGSGNNESMGATSNIFISSDFYTNNKKLMVIICGSGQVRAGQWARSLCINDCLDTGTILPYLEAAKARGYSFVILNPNQTTGKVGGQTKYVRGSQSPWSHVEYVNRFFIRRSPAAKVVIVAHSFGGQLTMNLLQDKPLFKRLVAIGLTDSVHGGGRFKQHVEEFLAKNCCNWVISSSPLDTEMGQRNSCIAVSAGTTVHERSSASCMHSLFKFIDQRMGDLNLPKGESKDHEEHEEEQVAVGEE